MEQRKERKKGRRNFDIIDELNVKLLGFRSMIIINATNPR